jgi:hypothetical protein
MQPLVLRESRVFGATASHERGPTDSPLLEVTIGEHLRQVTERFGEREALAVAHQDYRATYRELYEQVELAARALIANGVRKGDRVGIWAPNRYEWVIVQYATARIGAILVTINPAYKCRREACEVAEPASHSAVRLGRLFADCFESCPSGIERGVIRPRDDLPRKSTFHKLACGLKLPPAQVNRSVTA